MGRLARIALWSLFALGLLLAVPSRAEEDATHTDRLIVKYRSAAARIAAATKPPTRALSATRLVRETATGATVLQLAAPCRSPMSPHSRKPSRVTRMSNTRNPTA